MIRIADAIEELLQTNDFLAFGLHKDLLNLSQLARYLQPLIEARTLKEVQVSAIQMNLSRIKRRKQTVVASPLADFYIDKINIHTDLVSFTVAKSNQAHRDLNEVYNTVRQRGGFMTITEGISEITSILEKDHFPIAQETMRDSLKHVHHQLASVGVKFNEKFLEVPGVLHAMLQMVAMQGINVLEVSSTATEFIIYIQKAQVNLAFESILTRFGKDRPKQPW
ncbi:hypothetical protein [Acanthopleuribacter pedis]|uniref:Aspartate kinase n=1 Tax=Acanthopleuribacter pedis TaxID=442870 RepID=A0A8J7U7P8_9BACT|nr:hypothetical protein [Acanthopleuribacter pedis]MBO1321636.1 hypothetical protein [Acanthopleuribacter pedis]